MGGGVRVRELRLEGRVMVGVLVLGGEVMCWGGVMSWCGLFIIFICDYPVFTKFVLDRK